jgi:hypothetical protein
MIFLWAGLQDISQHIQEAAEIDGANRFQRFWFVTLPLLWRPLLFVLVTDRQDPVCGLRDDLCAKGLRHGGLEQRVRGWDNGIARARDQRVCRIRVCGAQVSGPERSIFFHCLTFLIPFEAIAIPLYTVVRAIGWIRTKD